MPEAKDRRRLLGVVAEARKTITLDGEGCARIPILDGGGGEVDGSLGDLVCHMFSVCVSGELNPTDCVC